MKTRLFLLLPLVFAASCSTDSGGNARPEPRKSLSQRLDETNGYAQDADGNWVPRSDKRSQFENKGRSPYFKGSYDKKTYQAGEYKRKSWWGNKEYGRPQYAGNTDGSRFQTTSRFDGAGAREAGNAARIPDPYQTGTYGTGAAREAGSDRLAKPGNAEIENRREVYQAPEIIDWREQRQLSLEQSRGILGR